ncbi:hypothetical protein BCR34DRAFT_551491 [Clohesyomyces aquaticus]|uniref:Uncharacterized protein n=1 Tax=Clohesyomyces aquaticus TaxID=1231657 RepID=A0A1Y2AAW6_9PLEO|nr:hypothetical protein BCR34DRAFT_551491 [Clohesyomyces aquaticus]
MENFSQPPATTPSPRFFLRPQVAFPLLSSSLLTPTPALQDCWRLFLHLCHLLAAILPRLLPLRHPLALKYSLRGCAATRTATVPTIILIKPVASHTGSSQFNSRNTTTTFDNYCKTAHLLGAFPEVHFPRHCSLPTTSRRVSAKDRPSRCLDT